MTADPADRISRHGRDRDDCHFVSLTNGQTRNALVTENHINKIVIRRMFAAQTGGEPFRAD